MGCWKLFEEKEVFWKVLDVPVYGTITISKCSAKKASVVMVAGSGPTDRNWCSPLLPGSNCSGKLIAEMLANNGYTSIRYDKIASGPHVMENLPRVSGRLSMKTHVEELSGAIKTLSQEEDIDPHNIFALTNSEGAIHAANYQLQARELKFKGLILTAPPGRSVAEVARKQLASQIGTLNNSDLVLKLYDEAVSEFLSGKKMNVDERLPDPVKRFLYSLEAPANLPFTRGLWAYRLADSISSISEPILVIIGKKDIQVDWKEDGEILKDALSQHRNVTFAFPQNANHILKHEELPLDKIKPETASALYNAPDARLDDEAVNTILTWLNDHS